MSVDSTLYMNGYATSMEAVLIWPSTLRQILDQILDQL